MAGAQRFSALRSRSRVDGLLAGRLVRGPVHEQGRQGDQDRRYRSTRGSRDSHEGGHRAQRLWRKILLPHLRQLLLFIATIYALTTVVLTWLPSYFEVGLGYSAMQAGSMFALPSIVGLVLMITSGSVTDKLIGRGFTSRTVRVIVPCVGVLICGSILLFLPQISTPIVAVASDPDRLRVLGTSPLINAAISEGCARRSRLPERWDSSSPSCRSVA